MWDLSDDEVQEEMAENPELWIQQRIRDPTVRVILGKGWRLSQSNNISATKVTEHIFFAL